MDKLRNLAWSFPEVFISLRLVVAGLGLAQKAQISCARTGGWWGSPVENKDQLKLSLSRSNIYLALLTALQQRGK